MQNDLAWISWTECFGLLIRISATDFDSFPANSLGFESSLWLYKLESTSLPSQALEVGNKKCFPYMHRAINGFRLETGIWLQARFANRNHRNPMDSIHRVRGAFFGHKMEDERVRALLPFFICATMARTLLVAVGQQNWTGEALHSRLP